MCEYYHGTQFKSKMCIFFVLVDSVNSAQDPEKKRQTQTRTCNPNSALVGFFFFYYLILSYFGSENLTRDPYNQIEY